MQNETSINELLSCPCGKIPKELLIQEGSTSKWAWVSGSCCNEWNVKFRAGYYKTDDPRCMELAIDAWNAALREYYEQYVRIETM